MFPVIAATDSSVANRQVAAEANARGKLVNVLNDPDSGNFTVPAMVRRRLLLAVGAAQRRSELFQAVAESNLLALLREGKAEEAERQIADIIGGLNDEANYGRDS